MPGYNGINCTTVCPYPLYGVDCQQLCNCTKDLCNVSNGCVGPTTGKDIENICNQIRCKWKCKWFEKACILFDIFVILFIIVRSVYNRSWDHSFFVMYIIFCILLIHSFSILHNSIYNDLRGTVIIETKVNTKCIIRYNMTMQMILWWIIFLLTYMEV